jgi:hypothetical protein
MFPRYSNNEERRQAYNDERSQRWGLEEALLDPVAALICAILSEQLGSVARYQKYAEPRIRAFEKAHPGVSIPAEIRGAPDLSVECGNHTWLVELKIKTKRFFNTTNGSKGIPNYGCQSHYLDDDPVYINLLNHAAYYRVALQDIVLVYAVNPNATMNTPIPLLANQWQFECVRLDILKKNIEQGRYQIYTGGYGQPTWLIRCDDLQDLAHTFG